MRKYLVLYWTEQNDCATDVEMIVEADNIEQALAKFKQEVRLYKRIYGINELAYNALTN